MKTLHAVAHHPQPGVPTAPMTLGWTEFAIVGVILVMLMLVTGFVMWPW